MRGVVASESAFTEDAASGAAIVFHFLTVHGASGNASKSVRRRAFARRRGVAVVRFKLRWRQGLAAPPGSASAAARR